MLPKFLSSSLILLVLFALTLPDRIHAQDASENESKISDAAAPKPVLIQNVRVFDGERVIETTDVLLQDGLIHGLGESLVAPEGAEIIDGRGKTLLPGLIDSHVHAYFEAHLTQATQFGVTTVLDMMNMPVGAANLRASQAAGKANHRADFFSAGAAVTVEGGHGTQFGFKVPVLANADEAEQFINDRIREGSDYIKIIHEPGTAFGMKMSTLSPEMLQAAIEACLERDILVVAHIGDMEGAAKTVEFGINGLVHLFANEQATDELIKSMLEKKVFVVPTAAVIQNASGPSTVGKIIDDPHIGPMLNQMDLAGLGRTFPAREGTTNSVETLRANIAALEKAGVPILAGTDSPNPGTTHGASMHHELELLVEAGLTNQQALAAATSRPADSFRLNDRGRIQAGKRADIILVNGNPVEDIKVTRNIDRIWKFGHSVDRQKRLEQIRKARQKQQGKQ